MNHSDIYSQAVVEEDSDYLKDSFCVDTDDDIELFADETLQVPADAHDAGVRKLRNRNAIRNAIRNGNEDDDRLVPFRYFFYDVEGSLKDL